MNNGNFLNFFAELVSRFAKPSPLFFKIISWASATAAFITGLPALLTSSGIVLPANILALENKTVAIASLAGLFISKLTVVDASQSGLPMTNPTTNVLPTAAPLDSTANTTATKS